MASSPFLARFLGLFLRFDQLLFGLLDLRDIIRIPIHAVSMTERSVIESASSSKMA